MKAVKTGIHFYRVGGYCRVEYDGLILTAQKFMMKMKVKL